MSKRKRDLPAPLEWYKDTIRARFWIAGKEYRRNLHTADQLEAVEAYRALRKQIESELEETKGRSRLTELGDQDLDERKAEGVSEAHLRQVERNWLKVIFALEKHGVPGCFSLDALTEYINERRRAGARGQTISREVECVKRAAKIAFRWGWIDREIAEWPKIRKDPPNKQQAGKYRDPALLRDWFDLLHRDARDEMMFYAATGLRAYELKRVRIEWIRENPGGAVPYILELPAEATKNRKERIVGLTDAVFAIVRNRHRDGRFSDGEPVFSQKDFKKHCAAASRKLLGPGNNITRRDLRHTFATLALWKTGDAKATMSALGHSDLAMTDRYAKSTVERTIGTGSAVGAELFGDQTGKPDRKNQDPLPQDKKLLSEIKDAGVAQLVEHQLPKRATLRNQPKSTESAGTKPAKRVDLGPDRKSKPEKLAGKRRYESPRVTSQIDVFDLVVAMVGRGRS